MIYGRISNDGRYPDDTRVQVRYPRTPEEEQGDGDDWPWLPATIMEQTDINEWWVRVDVDALAVPDEHGELLYPACWRDPSEIRRILTLRGRG